MFNGVTVQVTSCLAEANNMPIIEFDLHFCEMPLLTEFDQNLLTNAQVMVWKLVNQSEGSNLINYLWNLAITQKNQNTHVVLCVEIVAMSIDADCGCCNFTVVTVSSSDRSPLIILRCVSNQRD